MADVAIRADHVWKKYSRNLGAAMRYGLRDAARDFVGLPVDADSLRRHEFWSVRDASFEVQRGECLAILGPNGAGKSSMLKMLNGIFLPDKGSIELNGRVGALIELGAGFSPMLTGRENIYINGTILGLTRAEIDERFDDIVAFADIGDFLDTAVKFYSSGMYVRLGFSIAAQVKPDILLIDEVLAVGDVGFRTKCFRHLNMLVEQGTSIVIVSHSPQSLNRVTDRSIVFAEGEICFDGSLQEGIGVYHNLLDYDPKSQGPAQLRRAPANGVETRLDRARIESVRTVRADGSSEDAFHTGDDVLLEVKLSAAQAVKNARLIVAIENPNVGKFASISSPYKNFEFDLEPPGATIRMRLKNTPLLVGGYKFNVSLFGPAIDDFYDRVLQVGAFKIVGPKIDTNGYGVCELLMIDHEWERIA
jgi:lipopolysaccharide transport system ATP-binding protein